MYKLNCIVQIISIFICALIGIAYFTLAERKIIASIQRRRGPDVVGIFGLLQPIADGVKLLLKETVYPSSANLTIFLLAPILTFFLSMLSWTVIPFGNSIVFLDFNLGLFFLLAVSSLEVYGVIMGGWASNSKYAFLGSIRSAAQMISYEVSLGLILLSVILCAGSMNLSKIVEAQRTVFFCIPLFPMFVLFYITALAETNRHPFDLPEAEAELVSGYNVEYSSISFALYFLAEYGNMLIMSLLTVILFLGGWLPILIWLPGPIWLALKSLIFVIVFVLARACLPRFRYDQLMRLGWKVFLPFSLGWFMLQSAFFYTFEIYPILS